MCGNRGDRLSRRVIGAVEIAENDDRGVVRRNAAGAVQRAVQHGRITPNAAADPERLILRDDVVEQLQNDAPASLWSHLVYVVVIEYDAADAIADIQNAPRHD